MECEFNYCIYNKDSICILEKITVDGLGMCEPREIVSMPEEDLQKYKEKRLETIKQIWEDYAKQDNL